MRRFNRVGGGLSRALELEKILIFIFIFAFISCTDFEQALITSYGVFSARLSPARVVLHAYAGSEQSEAEKKAQEQQREAQKKEAERQREAEKKAQEQQREAQKKEAERQREADKKAQEQQREAAKKAEEQQREEAKKSQEQQREIAKKSQEKQNKSDENDQGTSEADQAAKKDQTDEDGDGDDGDGLDAIEDEGIPDTVVGVFKKISKKLSRNPKSEAKKAKRRSKKQTSSSAIRLHQKDSYKTDEVVALDLNQRALDRARQLGFKVKSSTEVGSLGVRATRLIAPPDMDASEARALLKQEVPSKSFALNQIYRIHVPEKAQPPKNNSGQKAPGRVKKLDSSGKGNASRDKSGSANSGQSGKGRRSGNANSLSSRGRGIGSRIEKFNFPVGPDLPSRSDRITKLDRIERFRLPDGPARPTESYRFTKPDRLDRNAQPDNWAPITTPDGQRRQKLAQNPACLDDHCFGRSVIKWDDRLQSCSSGVRVGMIDSSIDLDHPTFRGRRIEIGGFVPEGRPVASSRHGTSVMALLAGDPRSSTPGLIPDAKFFAANVFYTSEAGRMSTDTVSLLKALDWMDAAGVNIVNMSFTGPNDDLLHKAIERMSQKGVIFVAAAGNEGPTAPPTYPAAYPEVVAVTAVNKQLHGYPRANRGDYVDVAAPGVGVWTALPDQNEGYRSGTSIAVPHVTALLATVYNDRTFNRGQGAGAKRLIDSLPVRDLGPEGRDPVYGRGLLQAPEKCKVRMVLRPQ